MQIRPFRESDYDDLYRIYLGQTKILSYHHDVTKEQFLSDLFTSRFIRTPEHHHPEARIALVATRNERPCALVSGGLVTKGDEVVETGTGYIQAIIAERAEANALKTLVPRVVEHVRQFGPHVVTAFDACMCPPFFTDSAGSLPSEWAWIGQCLSDVGFEIRGRSLRLVNVLDRPRPQVQLPVELKVLHVTHEMDGFDPEYDFGCVLLKPPHEYGDGVVWCGNFYAGVFVKGTAFDSLYMNYFTIVDEDYRGKGLGRLVLQHCLFEAQQRGAKFASLQTDIDNFVALNLYQSEGFKVVDAGHSFELKVN